MNIQSYLTVKEKIKDLSSDEILDIFLEQLIIKKVNYYGLTQKYIEYQEILRSNGIDKIREISNIALDLVFDKVKDRKASEIKVVDVICHTGMFNERSIRDRMDRKLNRKRKNENKNN